MLSRTLSDKPYNRLMTGFFINIMSSWIVSPLGVLILHHLGYGSDRHLISLLLCMGAAAPFQLLCNEYLAAGASKDGVVASRDQLGSILIVQLLVTFVVASTFGTASARLDLLPRMVMCALLMGSTLLSYASTVLYYRAIVRHELRYRSSMIVGAIPGLTTLGVYLTAGLLHAMSIILVAAIAPAAAQWLYMQSHAVDGALALPTAQRPSWPLLVVATILLGLAATANALVRGEIGFLDQRFVALILTALNLVGTVVLMTNRAAYLIERRSSRSLTAVAGVGAGVLAVALLPFVRPAALLSAFLALQLLVAAVIAWLRNARTLPADRPEPAH